MSGEVLARWRRDGAWRELTASRAKFDLFADDTDFVAGLKAASWQEPRRFAQVLRSHAVLVIQPDCMARRASAQCLEIVRSYGFAPVAMHRTRLTPDVVSRIWRYQSHASTDDSLFLADLVCGAGDSVVVLLRDLMPDGSPASLRLTELKGPSRPQARASWQLRARLGAPGVLVVLVHTSDEPADVVRELQVIAPSAVEELFAAMESARPLARQEVDAMVRSLEEEIPAHDLDSVGARARLRGLAKREPGAGGRLADMLFRAESGVSPLAWSDFAECLEVLGVSPREWDPILVANDLIVHDVPGESRAVLDY